MRIRILCTESKPKTSKKWTKYRQLYYIAAIIIVIISSSSSMNFKWVYEWWSRACKKSHRICFFFQQRRNIAAIVCLCMCVWKCIKLNWECFHYNSGSRRNDYSTTAIYLFRCCSVCLLCCLVHRARIVLVCLAHRKWAARKSERVRRKSIWNDDDKRCSKRGNRMRKKDTNT